MGSGIITALLSAGYSVTLKEINAKAAEAGVGRVKSNLSAAVKKGKMTPAGVAWGYIDLLAGWLVWLVDAIIIYLHKPWNAKNNSWFAQFC